MICFRGTIIIMCSVEKEDRVNCQYFIGRGINQHVCPNKVFFVFLFHAVELPRLQKARPNWLNIIATMRSI